MILQVFCVYDCKAEAYMQPFFFQGRGQAIRAFTDLANDKSTSVGSHPADYTLFQIGDFNDSSAELGSITHNNLGNALEFVQLPDPVPDLFKKE